MSRQRPALLVLEDLSGHRLQGGTIRLYRIPGGAEAATLLSDEHGEAPLPMELGGEVIIVANYDDGVRRMSCARRLDLDQAREEGQVLSLSPTRTAVVGVVLRKGNEVAGLPIHGTAVPDAVTDADGFFEIGDFSTPTVDILIEASGQTLYETSFALRTGRTEFVLIDLPGVGIRVVLASEQDGPRTLNDLPVTVQTLPISAYGVYRSDITGADGVAYFSDLPPGDYLVSAVRPDIAVAVGSLGYSEVASGWAPKHARVQMEREDVEIRLELEEPAILRYRVVDAEHGWQVPARVWYSIAGVGMVYDPHRGDSVSSDEIGALSLPSGEVRVIAANNKHGWGELHLTLDPGQTVEADLVLSTTYPGLTFRVFGTGAEQIDEFQVHDDAGNLVWYLGGCQDVPGPTVTFSVGGGVRREDPEEPPQGLYSFSIPALPPGHYAIECFVEGKVVAAGGTALASDTVLDLFMKD